MAVIWPANERQYGREVQQQGLDYSQGLATNDLAYRRMVEENQLREGRGLAESERNYRMDTTQNETEQARRWQEYSAAIAEQDRIWGRYSTMAGYGQDQTNTLAQAGANYGNNMNSIMSQFGNAQAAGGIAQGNAQAGMWNNIGQGLSQFGQMAMYGGMYGGNEWGRGNQRHQWHIADLMGGVQPGRLSHYQLCPTTRSTAWPP